MVQCSILSFPACFVEITHSDHCSTTMLSWTTKTVLRSSLYQNLIVQCIPREPHLHNLKNTKNPKKKQTNQANTPTSHPIHTKAPPQTPNPPAKIHSTHTHLKQAFSKSPNKISHTHTAKRSQYLKKKRSAPFLLLPAFPQINRFSLY